MDSAEITYLRRVLKDATSGPEWRPIARGIVIPMVGDIDPRGNPRRLDDEFDEGLYYGGDLIAESMNLRDALAACAAVVALPRALDAIERLSGAGHQLHQRALHLARGVS